MTKSINQHSLPLGAGPQRAPASEGPAPNGKFPYSPAIPGKQPDPETPERPLRRRFSAEYKLQILHQADTCQAGQLGALLRREGLYSSHLATWRTQRQQGVLSGLTPKKRGPKPNADQQLLEENRGLQRTNQQLVERLRQAEMIIDVQKKVAEILGTPIQTPPPGELYS